jgi:Phage tail lysozyme
LGRYLGSHRSYERAYGSPYASKRKIRKTGRHSSPSQVGKVAQRAGKAAPAVAVVGALAAAPQIRDLAFNSAPTATVTHQVRDRAALSDEAAAPAADSLNQYKAKAGRHSTPAARHVGGSSKPVTHTPAPSPSPSASSSPAPSGQPTPTSVQCAASTGMVPENYAAIVSFLTQHGYTGLAAAGIAGNIYQESKGDPESVGSGGGGLIGWTPLPAGFVTGNVSADLETQLEALLTYNQQWAQYIPMLNSASSATDAAYVYMTYFERPGIPAASNREAAAEAVAQACGL